MHTLLLMMTVAARLYVADSGDNKLTVIDSGKAAAAIPVSANLLDVVDPNTSRFIRSAPVGSKPGNLAVTPDGRYIYVCIGSRHAIDVVDTASLMKVKSIETTGSPRSIYATPDSTRMLVEYSGEIDVISVE